MSLRGLPLGPSARGLAWCLSLLVGSLGAVASASAGPPIVWRPLSARDAHQIDVFQLLRKGLEDPHLVHRFQQDFTHTGPQLRAVFLRRAKARILQEEDPRYQRAMRTFVTELELQSQFRLKTFRFAKVDRKDFLGAVELRGVHLYRWQAEGWVSKSDFRFLILGREQSLDALEQDFRAQAPEVVEHEVVRLEVRPGSGQPWIPTAPAQLDSWTALGLVHRLTHQPEEAVRHMVEAKLLPAEAAAPQRGKLAFRLLPAAGEEPLLEE